MVNTQLNFRSKAVLSRFIFESAHFRWERKGEDDKHKSLVSNNRLCFQLLTKTSPSVVKSSLYSYYNDLLRTTGPNSRSKCRRNFIAI